MCHVRRDVPSSLSLSLESSCRFVLRTELRVQYTCFNSIGPFFLKNGHNSAPKPKGQAGYVRVQVVFSEVMRVTTNIGKGREGKERGGTWDADVGGDDEKGGRDLPKSS